MEFHRYTNAKGLQTMIMMIAQCPWRSGKCYSRSQGTNVKIIWKVLLQSLWYDVSCTAKEPTGSVAVYGLPGKKAKCYRSGTDHCIDCMLLIKAWIHSNSSLCAQGRQCRHCVINIPNSCFGPVNVYVHRGGSVDIVWSIFPTVVLGQLMLGSALFTLAVL